MGTDADHTDRLEQWFRDMEGRPCTRRDLLELDTLLVGIEFDKPLNKAQQRAMQGVLATIDCALEHGIRGDYLADTIGAHLEAAGQLY